MTDDQSAPVAAGITRRTVIKGVGAGATVAWAAPSVLSMSRAMAAGTPGGCECKVQCDFGLPGRYTVGCITSDNEEANCQCNTTPTGDCICVHFPNGPFCEDYALCGPNFSCPSGFACVQGCCFADKPICAPIGCPPVEPAGRAKSFASLNTSVFVPPIPRALAG